MKTDYMENLFKTIYFDYKMFRAVPLSKWLALTLSKYKCLIFILLGVRPVYLQLRNKIEVSNVSDLGTTISSLSDEYFHLYKILNNDVNVVVDIGANIGQFTNAIKYWYPNATIHAFEPDPDTYKILKRNTVLASVHTYNIACASHTGPLDFFRAEVSGMSSLVKSTENQEHIKVPADTADNLLRNVPSIDLFKIDVEGAELSVLRGAHEALRKSKYLLIEISFDRTTDGWSNMDVLAEVRNICPKAQIIHTGRPLGNDKKVTAQDFLLKLS